MTKRVPIQEPYRRISFSHTDEVGDGTDTDHYVEADAETKSEQLSPTDVNPRSTKYDLCHNLKPMKVMMMTKKKKFKICLGMVPGATTYTIGGLGKIDTDRLRSNYVPTNKTPSITPGTASGC